jgi:uncharacterized membrane protein YbhN (UPF0104 family)
VSLATHLVLLALVLVDLVFRAWRLRVLLPPLGHPLRFWPAFLVNVVGETAAVATPMRAGVQPARIGALACEGAPLLIATVAIAVEAVLLYIVVIAIGIGLGIAFAPDWLPSLREQLPSIEKIELWLVVLAIASAVAVWAGRRLAGRLRGRGVGITRIAHAVRGLPPRVALAVMGLSVLDVLARVALLPVIVATVNPSLDVGPVSLGSFAMLYGQVVTPTPAGAGAVELMFLGGGAGELGSAAGRLLFWWRVYSVGLAAGAGAVLALTRYGPALARALSRLRRARAH